MGVFSCKRDYRTTLTANELAKLHTKCTLHATVSYITACHKCISGYVLCVRKNRAFVLNVPVYICKVHLHLMHTFVPFMLVWYVCLWILISIRIMFLILQTNKHVCMHMHTHTYLIDLLFFFIPANWQNPMLLTLSDTEVFMIKQ